MNDYTNIESPRRRSENIPWRRDRRVLATTTSQSPQRSKSMPAVVRLSSIMKIITLDESLHSKYGDKSVGLASCQSAPTKLHNPRIQWDNVQIREYSRCLGDNPSCSSGPPVSIDWEYGSETAVPLDAYEKNRPPRRTNGQMLLPRSVRQDMLMKEWQVPRSHIASAVRTNIKIKNKRRQTVNNMSEQNEKIEKIVQSAGRKLKRTLLFKKKPSKEIQELQKQADKAAAIIAQMNAEEEVAYMNSIAGQESYEEEKTEEPVPGDQENGFILKGVTRRISEVSFSEADRACGEGDAYASDCTSLSDDDGANPALEEIEEKENEFKGPQILQLSPVIITEED